MCCKSDLQTLNKKVCGASFLPRADAKYLLALPGATTIIGQTEDDIWKRWLEKSNFLLCMCSLFERTFQKNTKDWFLSINITISV